MANINIKETVRRRIYMAKYSIITKTEKFFIGSLAACSYRIQYPVLDGAPTEINGFFERFAMALAGYAERRYAEMKASGRRLTADEAEIHSLRGFRKRVPYEHSIHIYAPARQQMSQMHTLFRRVE